MKDIGIFGTSGFAREVGDIALENGYKPIYIAHDAADTDAAMNTERLILESEIHQLNGASFSIGVGDNKIRQKIAARFSGTLDFINLTHPSATFGKNQRSALEGKSGVIICAGARFTNNIVIGNFSIFNLNSTIGHDVIVDDFANIAPGACISGNVHIGPRCWIGTGASINQGNTKSKLLIGENTIIGSGAVVTKVCEPNATYIGAPARRIK
ncbi:MAG: hypothetical protein V4624_02465 [Pseudomonadota bacterium]